MQRRRWRSEEAGPRDLGLNRTQWMDAEPDDSACTSGSTNNASAPAPLLALAVVVPIDTELAVASDRRVARECVKMSHRSRRTIRYNASRPQITAVRGNHISATIAVAVDMGSPVASATRPLMATTKVNSPAAPISRCAIRRLVSPDASANVTRNSA